jgi:hypothetical protein
VEKKSSERRLLVRHLGWIVLAVFVTLGLIQVGMWVVFPEPNADDLAELVPTGIDTSIEATITGPDNLIRCRRFCFLPDAKQTHSAVVFWKERDSSTGEWQFRTLVAGAAGDNWWSLVTVGPYEGPNVASTYRFPAMSLGNHEMNGEWIVTLGQGLPSTVSRVVAQLENGAVIEGPVVNGAYAVFSETQLTCKVSVFDREGKLIETVEELAQPHPGTSTCPSSSASSLAP